MTPPMPSEVVPDALPVRFLPRVSTSEQDIDLPDHPTSTIDRTAGQSAKGPRLQRLRACQFLLEAIADERVTLAYAAVEANGDVFIASSTAQESSSYSEEDKNYDESSSLTFFSPPVLNSVVIFLDQWLSWRCSDAIRFGLYTTASPGKERTVGRSRRLNITLPDKPILELLRGRDLSDPRLLPCIIAVVLDEYAAQYAERPQKGHLELLRQWPTDIWEQFLSCITWLLCEADHAVAEQRLLATIKASRFYTDLHEGREEFISAALLNIFDKRQSEKDFARRFVHVSDVELLYAKVASGEIRGIDPVWQAWDTVPPPTDTRNVSEKLLAVCPTLSRATLSRCQRRTAAALAELEAHAQDKNLLAMRFHIYDVCEPETSALAQNAAQLSESALEAELERLFALAKSRASERAAEYGYTHKTDALIRGLVLELFDSCFLALDGEK